MSSLSLFKLLSLPCQVRKDIVGYAIKCTVAPTSATPSQTQPFSTSRRRASAEQHAQSERPLNSVNQTEVSHFNALASSWWDPHGSSRLLHLMNPLRHRFIRQCRSSSAPDELSSLNILDIGCGGGIFAESAARLPTTKSVTAIDPTPEVIAVATRHQRHDPLLLEPRRLRYRNISIEDLESPKPAHDIITLFEVIEHIQHPSPFLETCLRHLKPGGWLIGSTIARTGLSWVTTKLVAEDLLRLVPRGTHDWNQYIQPAELRKWAQGQQELEAYGDGWQVMGVVYVPGFGWKEVPRSEDWGNYFFGVRKKDVDR